MTTIISLLNKLGGQAELANLNPQQLIALAKQHGLNAEQISLLANADFQSLAKTINAPQIKCIIIDEPDDVPGEDEDAPAEDETIKQVV
ncbi:hypothetical protein [Thalassotalea sp. ND16A]|uniref:hypothetical protein n=1 Tax=Thalassotalea sp. ND16A TaxID=1535422 RepID=UPI00051D44ED|nr:hypothetical protein [Thalassotalea sp. ND16A]KGJ89405.1 hypothetical protein ND16A_2298 [Thalassotalea sp. ND16A]